MGAIFHKVGIQIDLIQIPKLKEISKGWICICCCDLNNKLCACSCLVLKKTRVLIYNCYFEGKDIKSGGLEPFHITHKPKLRQYWYSKWQRDGIGAYKWKCGYVLSGTNGLPYCAGVWSNQDIRKYMPSNDRSGTSKELLICTWRVLHGGFVEIFKKSTLIWYLSKWMKKGCPWTKKSNTALSKEKVSMEESLNFVEKLEEISEL